MKMDKKIKSLYQYQIGMLVLEKIFLKSLKSIFKMKYYKFYIKIFQIYKILMKKYKQKIL